MQERNKQDSQKGTKPADRRSPQLMASPVRRGRITGTEGWDGVFDARDRIKPDTTRAVGVGRSAQHAEDEEANDNQLYGDC